MTEVLAINRHTLSLAAEYAVASELCRRGLYTQLTLGNLKQTDLLAMPERGDVVRIEVKAKQGATWPSCKGVSEAKAVIIFVDFSKKNLDENPDFYILTSKDWREYLERCKKKFEANGKRVSIRDDGVLVFEDQITKNGKPYVGATVSVGDVIRYKDAWEKVLSIANQGL